MRKIVVVLAVLTIAGAALLLTPSISQAAHKTSPARTAQPPASNPLAIIGNVVSDVRSLQGGQMVVFNYTIENNGSRPASIDFDYASWTDASLVSIICPLIRNHSEIDTDGNFCEPNFLAPHKTAQSSIILQAGSATGHIVIQVCSDDEANGARGCTSNRIAVND